MDIEVGLYNEHVLSQGCTVYNYSIITIQI